MRRVYRSELLPDVAHWKNVLEQRGIGCHIGNYYGSGALGELPWFEVLPELWVLDDRDAVLAEKVIRESSRLTRAACDPWRCSACGEQLEAQFTDCWHCGGARPATPLHGAEGG
jgi:hypothetical protein